METEKKEKMTLADAAKEWEGRGAEIQNIIAEAQILGPWNPKIPGVLREHFQSVPPKRNTSRKPSRRRRDWCRYAMSAEPNARAKMLLFKKSGRLILMGSKDFTYARAHFAEIELKLNASLPDIAISPPILVNVMHCAI
jgi:hypothetical protein